MESTLASKQTKFEQQDNSKQRKQPQAPINLGGHLEAQETSPLVGQQQVAPAASIWRQQDYKHQKQLSSSNNNNNLSLIKHQDNHCFQKVGGAFAGEYPSSLVGGGELASCESTMATKQKARIIGGGFASDALALNQTGGERNERAAAFSSASSTSSSSAATSSATTQQQQPSNSKKMSSHQCAKWSICKWILALLMGLFLILTTIFVALSSLQLLDDGDQCFTKNLPFQRNNYQLFATKTLYSTAYNYLNKPHQQISTYASANNNNPNNYYTNNNQQQHSSINININNPYNHNQVGQQPQAAARLAITSNNNYDKSSIHLPSIFSQQDSLESINRRLQSAEFGCSVRQLHYIGRHAARLPSSNELDKITRHIQAIQARINPSSLDQEHGPGLENVSQPQSQPIIRLRSQPQQANQAANSPITTTTTTTTSADVTNSSAVCSDPLLEYKHWASFAVPEQGNLLIESGVRETEAIAQRFKSMFPEMFDANLSKIDIGLTEELRTAQTALAFIRQFDNFSLDFCNLADFPQENTQDKSRAYEIHHSTCYRSLLNRFSKEKLSFHKVCRKKHSQELRISHNLNLKMPNRTEFIAQSISKKLKLTPQLTSEEAYALYEICRYESAYTGSSSIWCNLFSDKELRFYEFLSDIDDFYNTAYGHSDQWRSSCMVTRDLANSFRAARRQQAQGQTKPEAHFYFTHSQVIQKLLAASVDLSQDPEYAPAAVLEYLERGQAPKQRQWQTSLFTPFSANLAFTLYSCPRIGASSSAGSTSEGGADSPFSDFDVSSSPFKVVASLNEQPILLEGCSDYACDLSELLYNGRLNTEKNCRMNEICRNNIVVT